MLVFRRLAAGAGSERLFVDDSARHAGDGARRRWRRSTPARSASPSSTACCSPCTRPTAWCATTSPQRLAAARPQRRRARGAPRLPTSPADLMLRMVNHMVDSYLELRRLLTRQLGYLQKRAARPARPLRHDWQHAARLAQRAAPARGHLRRPARARSRNGSTRSTNGRSRPRADARRERELLRVRSRDVLEHIERVLAHVRRLESVGRDRGADALLGAEPPHQRHHAHADRADRDLPAAEPRHRLLRHELRCACR